MGENRNEVTVMQSPYVTQADKFAKSLRHLADTFLKWKEPGKVSVLRKFRK